MEEWEKYYAMIKLFFGIPHPENLTDDEFADNVRQLDWLSEVGLLGIKLRNNG